jgi:hypothetical protein
MRISYIRPGNRVSHVAFARLLLLTASLAALIYDCYISDPQGTILCTLLGLEVARHGEDTTIAIQKRHTLVYQGTGMTVTRCLPSPTHSIIDSGIGSDDESMSSRHMEAFSTVDTSSFYHLLYTLGCEIEVQQRLGDLDSLSDSIVWFTAEDGCEGQSAHGFTRSIRREYPAWQVYLVVFDRSWSRDEHLDAVKQLSSLNDVENEMFLTDKGEILVPRVRPLSPPTSRALFSPDEPWAVDAEGLCHTSLPIPLDGRVLVRITGISRTSDSFSAFVGHVDATNEAVMGITRRVVSNFTVATYESLNLLPSGTKLPDDSPPIVAIAIITSCLGASSLTHPERLRKHRILVTHADSDIGGAVARVLKALELEVVTMPSSASPYDLGMHAGTDARFIMSAYVDSANVQIMSKALANNGKMFFWNHPTTGLLARLEQEPWVIGDALKLASDLQLWHDMRQPLHSPLSLVPSPPAAGAMIPSIASLFRGDKAYMLVGGIGSLGFQVALWMYEVCC